MPWLQNYAPLNSVWLDPIVAALPVVIVLGLLATGKVAASRAALAGHVCAVLVAALVFVPKEAGDIRGWLSWTGSVLATMADGAKFGIFPIDAIVLGTIVLYTLTVETGQFEIVKRSVLSLSEDRRLQALWIAFCFGSLPTFPGPVN